MTLGSRRPVCQAERDSEVILFGRVKNSVDEWSIKLHVGNHDEDIPRGKLRVAIEPIQQVIVKHLQLPQRAVTRMDLDRRVLGRNRFLLHLALTPVAQVEDIGLDAGQNGVLTGVNKQGRVRFLPFSRFLHQV